MVWLSANEKFSKEFGDTTTLCFVNIKHPLVVLDYLRDKNGDIIMVYGEPAEIGYLAEIPSKDLAWIQENYDGVIDPSMDFVIAFSPEQVKAIEPEENSSSTVAGTKLATGVKKGAPVSAEQDKAYLNAFERDDEKEAAEEVRLRAKSLVVHSHYYTALTVARRSAAGNSDW